MKLILPKTFVDRREINYPLFFIAGPIKGGANWQEKMCLELGKRITEFFAVIPNRWDHSNSLFCYRVSGKQDYFARQTAWEHFYLDLAAERSKRHQGALIFFLPCESKSEPRNDGQPYARDTYGELGAWRRSRAIDHQIHLLIGAEPDFPGHDVILSNIHLDLGTNFPIYSSIEEVATAAANWVNI